MTRKLYRIVLAKGTGLDEQIEKTILQRSNFEVFSARDGFAAVTLAARELPDLVILGFEMAALDGPHACEKLRAREDTRDMPVLIVCKREGEDVRKSCEAARASAVVFLSSGLDHVVQVVADMLRIPPRKTVRIAVVLTVEKGKGIDVETLGRATNLSEGGMGLEASRPLEVETDLRLRFTLPGDHQRIEAGGRVRWVDRRDRETYAMGVEFVSVAEAFRTRLNNYLDRSLTVG